MEEVSTLLDYSISTQGYVIKPSATTANYIDLSQIDFETLRAKFEKGRKATEAQKLRGTDCSEARPDGASEPHPH